MYSDLDIENLIKNQKWGKGKQLILPSYYFTSQKDADKTTELDKTMFICITHKELSESKYEIDEIKKEISKFSVYDCLASLSKIGIVLENDGAFSHELQAKMLSQLFHPDLKKQIIKYLLKNKGKPCFVFSEKQILKLMKCAILYAKDTPQDNFSNGDDFYDFSSLLIAINDSFEDEFSKQGKRPIEKDDFLKYSIQNDYLNFSEQFRYLIGRYINLFLKIPLKPEIKNLTEHFDLNKEFKEATTFNLDEYFAVGFSLLTNFMGASVLKDKMKDRIWFINQDTYFDKTQISNKEPQRIFDSFCINLNKLKGAMESTASNPDNFNYDYTIIKQYPLLEYTKTQRIPLSLRFLKEKITAGIYWTLLDHMKEKYGYKGIGSFTRFFGKIFENYITTIFERFFPESPFLAKRLFLELKYGKEERKTSDLIILYADKAVFIEIKSSRLHTTKTAIMGDMESFNKDLNDNIIKAARQLDRVINDFKAGLFRLDNIDAKSIKKYYPIIITLESFPQNFLIWEKINTILKKDKYLCKKDISSLQILDCEEIEIIESLIAKGISFIDIIDDKVKDNTSINIPMKNFLHFSKYKNSIGINAHLKTEFNNFTKEVKGLFFGSKEKPDG